MTGNLPELPSELITVALADLRKIEAMSDKYNICILDWYSPELNEVFSVYLAGSFMAITLGSDIVENLSTCDFDDEISEALRALNAFREGRLYDAFIMMGIKFPETLPIKINVPKYGPGFHEAITTMAVQLKEAGY